MLISFIQHCGKTIKHSNLISVKNITRDAADREDRNDAVDISHSPPTPVSIPPSLSLYLYLELLFSNTRIVVSGGGGGFGMP